MTPQELKNSILQMAIQGKLVEQRPEEGTAEELYKQIQAEKQALIKAGKLKKEKPLLEITEDEIPFEIPESWKWVQFGFLSQLLDGETRRGEAHPCLDAKYLRGKSEALYLNAGKFVYRGEKIILVDGENSGEVFVVPQDGYMGSTFKKLFYSSAMYEPYVLFFLLYHKKDYRNNKKGSAIPHLNKELFFNMPTPVPPLEEQKRIVAKIEELLPLIERYEKAWSRLEDFNKRFPGDMQKSILQMAIQGKLVEQRPEEGTGEELYKQIQEEKQTLLKAGKIKKEKPLPEIAEDEIPFEIPESWKWVRLPEIGELNRGRSQHRPRNAPELFVGGIYPFVQTGDVAQTDYHITQWKSMYNAEGLAQSRLWPKGTLCLTIAANIGDVAILDFDACFPDSVVGFNSYAPIDSNLFVMYGLMSYKNHLDELSRSTAQKNINIDILSKVAFPLPPLAEQKRIVARLEELLPLCEKLK